MHLQRIDSKDPKLHAQNLARYIAELREHFREDCQQIEDPNGKKLFESSAQVLEELENALNRFHDDMPEQ